MAFLFNWKKEIDWFKKYHLVSGHFQVHGMVTVLIPNKSALTAKQRKAASNNISACCHSINLTFQLEIPNKFFPSPKVKTFFSLKPLLNDQTRTTPQSAWLEIIELFFLKMNNIIFLKYPFCCAVSGSSSKIKYLWISDCLVQATSLKNGHLNVISYVCLPHKIGLNLSSNRDVVWKN